MKFDINKEITGFDGQSFQVSEGKNLTLKDVIHLALRAPVLFESGQGVGTPRPLMVSDLDEREKIIEGIKEGVFEIRPEQVLSLRKLIGASGLMPEICLSVSILLNNGDN